MACVCVCCTVSMGLARVVWTLGLAERTEPLVLPYTVTCSTGGPSVDCMAVQKFENALLNTQITLNNANGKHNTPVLSFNEDTVYLKS